MFQIYKKKQLLSKKISGKYFVVNQAKGTLIELNESSFFLWKKLRLGCSESDLLKLLVKEYSVDNLQASKDIKSFLKMALSSGIIEPVE